MLTTNRQAFTTNFVHFLKPMVTNIFCPWRRFCSKSLGSIPTTKFPFSSLHAIAVFTLQWQPFPMQKEHKRVRCPTFANKSWISITKAVAIHSSKRQFYQTLRVGQGENHAAPHRMRPKMKRSTGEPNVLQFVGNRLLGSLKFFSSSIVKSASLRLHDLGHCSSMQDPVLNMEQGVIQTKIVARFNFPLPYRMQQFVHGEENMDFVLSMRATIQIL